MNDSIIERHIDNSVYMTCTPNPAPFELLQSKIGRNARTRMAARADGVTNQQEFESWYDAEVARVCHVSRHNQDLMRSMKKTQRLEWIKDLVNQVIASDMPFHSDAYNTIHDCDLVQWNFSSCEDYSHWVKRAYQIVGFPIIKVQNYQFRSPTDWATSLFMTMGINLKRP